MQIEYLNRIYRNNILKVILIDYEIYQICVVPKLKYNVSNVISRTIKCFIT